MEVAQAVLSPAAVVLLRFEEWACFMTHTLVG
jgi:hypothetical protein